MFLLLNVGTFLPLFALLLVPVAGEAASYCDRVRAGGDLVDPQLLLCEDFEAPTLINDVGFGQGAPNYGPWYDHTGAGGCLRGINSYWTRHYGNGLDNALWPSGTPASPTHGCTCTYGLCMDGAWDASDRWQANSFAVLGILQNSDFNVEVSSITRPTNTSSGTPGVFQGNASLGHRIMAGEPNAGSILGGKSWSAVRTFGITMAVAYPTNSGTSGIWGNPWKHNEWDPSGSGLFLFHNENSLNSQVPFEHFIFISGGMTEAQCIARVAAATKTAGVFSCVGDIYFSYNADPGYSRATDWPFGTWGCVEGDFQNMGLSNSSIKIWFTGPAGVRKKIIDISGMNLTGTVVSGGVSGFVWNNYSNANQGGGTPTTQTTFRYEDNVHIRAGAPVSCAQIGFASVSGVPPAAPSSLIVQ